MPTSPPESLWTVEMWSYRTRSKVSTMSFPTEGKARFVTERGIRKFARIVPRAVLINPQGEAVAVMTSMSGIYAWLEAATYRAFPASHQFCMPVPAVPVAELDAAA
ncbi:hypothetical protein E4T66_17470 [Sinimarinibacterium sp. CAU 1509]|uniref:hypothetical protein n=1 Tax=Sinimarinibacterium sp. CAU 1509 TaxID=2562283 RepID=UPI0010AC8D0E|nr:hypothetical protein [Sinimarinibacterium sp. CAU 1509]TJY57199.1 hypothetical protein E4T66_17470 [Sinimarinibacterium sp. CAU 1509]